MLVAVLSVTTGLPGVLGRAGERGREIEIEGQRERKGEGERGR
jgi:hypothetical protein